MTGKNHPALTIVIYKSTITEHLTIAHSEIQREKMKTSDLLSLLAIAKGLAYVSMIKAKLTSTRITMTKVPRVRKKTARQHRRQPLFSIDIQSEIENVDVDEPALKYDKRMKRANRDMEEGRKRCRKVLYLILTLSFIQSMVPEKERELIHKIICTDINVAFDKLTSPSC